MAKLLAMLTKIFIPLSIIWVWLPLFVLSDSIAETTLLNSVSADGAREHLRYITSFPHPAGTYGDYQSAMYVKEKFEEYGIPTHVESIRVLLNFPVNNSLQLITPTDSTNLVLAEVDYEIDPTADTWYRNHTFFGYSASGIAEGAVVYANYGSVEDFRYLDGLGIDLKGKIALIRYGGIFRGLKVKHAQDHGMAGVLIYSDPLDDGFSKGDVYPQGRWRPPSGVQRGSVQFNSLCPGDSGFVERDPDICGYPTDEIIPRIPALPLSYGNAQPILAQLGGPDVPDGWVGGLNLAYKIGGGDDVRVRLDVNVRYNKTDIWNVVGTIPGCASQSKVAKQQILIGNHRDAWVYGAADPNSGTAVLLEVARGLGESVRAGWCPQRTIVLLSWDSEEYGLVGSTGYGERHAQALSDYAVAYFNVDVGVTGDKLSVSVTPSLHTFISSVLQDVQDPKSGNSVYDSWDKTFNRLGSGSDYTVFFDHLGIASSDSTFNGGYGVYHSVYDSFYWMEHFGDPGFQYHKAHAQIWGLMAIRMADAFILPFDYRKYDDELRLYMHELSDMCISGSFPLDLSSLQLAIDNFHISVQAVRILQDALKFANSSSLSVSRLNWHLYTAERQFLTSFGLPQRKWFKHVVFAPGIDEGYAANIFPGIVQAIKTNSTDLGAEQVEIAAKAVQAVAAHLLDAVVHQ